MAISTIFCAKKRYRWVIRKIATVTFVIDYGKIEKDISVFSIYWFFLLHAAYSNCSGSAARFHRGLY